MLTLVWAAVPSLGPVGVAEQATQEVRSQELVRAITALQDTPGRSRVTGTAGAIAGREVVRQKLQSYGLQPERWPFEVRHPFNHGAPAQGVNLVLRLGPSEGKALVLVAHLDTKAAEDADSAAQAGWHWATDPAPGADDNGSGAAVLLEVARVLAGRQASLHRPILLVWSDAEELATIASDSFMGNYGGQALADRLMLQGEPVAAALSIDMLLHARPYGALLRLYSDGRAASSDLALVLALCAQRFSPQVVVDLRISPGFTWSDHGAFWALGQGGLLLIEDDYHHPRYHQPTDHYAGPDDLYGIEQVLWATRFVVAATLLY